MARGERVGMRGETIYIGLSFLLRLYLSVEKNTGVFLPIYNYIMSPRFYIETIECLCPGSISAEKNISLRSEALRANILV